MSTVFGGVFVDERLVRLLTALLVDCWGAFFSADATDDSVAFDCIDLVDESFANDARRDATLFIELGVGPRLCELSMEVSSDTNGFGFVGGLGEIMPGSSSSASDGISIQPSYSSC